MHGSGLLVLAALVISVTAQAGLPTPPRFFPRGKTPPANMKNCRIDSRSIFPWIVGVWDKAFLTYVGLGSMITYHAFVTSCRQYTAPNTAYKAVAQLIWNLSRPDLPCMQEKIISEIHKHPNCLKSPKEATFFDFAVFRTIYPFDITGDSYPTASFPRNPLELMGLITYLDDTPKTVDCVLPHFRNQIERPPRFNWDTFVQVVPFQSVCVELLCERDPPDPRFSKMCEERLGKRANATMLCMRNQYGENITLGVRDSYWYAGSPLTCNGTAYGIAAQAKIRKNFKRPPWYDIHFVVTFIRVWVWLNNQIVRHSPKWPRVVHIQNVVDKSVSIPDPYTSLPPTKPYYFYDWVDKGRSDANVQVPSLKNMVFLILSRLIFIQY